MQQLHHHNTSFHKHAHEIVLICNYISSPANLGMIFRNAEAFGVNKIILSLQNKSFTESHRFKKIARNTFQEVKFEVIESVEECIARYAKNSFEILAIELTKKSKPIQKTNTDKRILLILGNENNGIPENILSLCPKHAHINMYGKKSSINVAQALGICLYEITS